MTEKFHHNTEIKKDIGPNILIDWTKENWELWDSLHKFNDWKIWEPERKLVVSYLEDKNKLSDYTKYQRNLLNKEINGDFKIKILHNLKIMWRSFVDLKKALKKEWFYKWDTNWNFSKELLISLINFQKKNKIKPFWLFWEKTAEKLFFQKYYELIKQVAEKENFPADKLLKLVKLENPYFIPNKKAKNSTAFWLTQMNDKTWDQYWKDLDRNNPEHQLIAAVRYMKVLVKKTWDYSIAFALYNAWENFADVKSINTIKNYIRKNPKIAKKIVEAWKQNLVNKSVQLAKKVYLIASVAAYENISYNEAKKIVNNKWNKDFLSKMRFIV